MSTIVETLKATPRGARTRTVARLATRFGVSPATVWRAAAPWRQSRAVPARFRSLKLEQP